MEFIPLEKYSKFTKKAQKAKNKKVQNLKESEDQGSSVKKIKRKPQTSVTEKRNLKYKCREIVVPKKKKTIPKRRFGKKRNEEEDKEDEEDEEYEEDKIIDEDENRDVNDEEENEVDDNQNEDEEEKDNKDHDFKRKCKELDEKKRNRLFLKLKKKIYSDTQIKELHPDIRSVIFPRKKNSRWCWAVFASEEKADKAMEKLMKNKDVFVNKPNPYEKVILKRKEKMKTVLRKKEARKKLQKMWM